MATVIALTTPLPIGGVKHARAVITNAAGTLASTISGGLPTISIADGEQTIVLQPTGVQLSIESASAANKVYYTLDGTTPTATNGFELSSAPGATFFPLGANTAIWANFKVLGSAAAVNTQCLFTYQK